MYRAQAKSVFILENDRIPRHSLAGALSARGFAVTVAASADEALGAVGGISGGPDVCVLDMSLEQHDKTGAMVGQEIRRRFSNHPPEFLIYSGHGKEDYIQQAFELDAANYLRKGDDKAYKDNAHPAVVRHARVLALRRALAGERPGLLEEIDQIASRSQSRAEALVALLREVLCPEFKESLGAPFLILYSADGETRLVAASLELPCESRAYSEIQVLLEKNGDPSKPVILHHGPAWDVAKDGDHAAAAILTRLHDTAFVPLCQLGRVKISLGIIKAKIDQLLPEEAFGLAQLVNRFLQPTLTGLLLTLTREIRMRQRAVLDTTSRFCLYVGQEQISLVDGVIGGDTQSGEHLAPGMYQLRRLGEELRSTGELLGEVASPPPRHRPDDSQPVEMAALLHDVWEDILIDFPQLQRELLEIRGECRVLARPGTLYVAMARILRWLANRNVDTVENTMPRICITCDPRESKILIRDGSERLPPAARKRLFSLYTPPAQEEFKKLGRGGEFLGLYLSNVLIEIESGGNLEDVTDSSKQETGHSLLIRFPAAGGEPADRGTAGGVYA
jgi:CheY-like chemotaxis protein